MSLLRKLFFNLMYFRNPPWDTGISPPELVAFIQSHPPGRALDLGCGTGTNAITLAQHNWEVTGVDFVGRAIRKARRKARQAKVKVNFYVDDVTRLKDVSGKFDLVLDIGCFHGLSQARRKIYLDNLERLLAPGGTYLLYVFFRDEETENGPGAVEADLQGIASRLELVERQDGTERGWRPSAWLTFQKPPSQAPISAGHSLEREKGKQ